MAGLVLLLFFAFLFVAMFLALFLAYQSAEGERRASATGVVERPWETDAPRFFANLAPAATGIPDAVPALVVRQVQEHVRREECAVAAYVEEPSAERLAIGYPDYVAAMVEEMERHIRQESLRAADFVAEPSLERLFPDALPRAGERSRRATSRAARWRRGGTDGPADGAAA